MRSGSRFGFGSAAHATNSERINNRQSNRIVKNSFALAAYTDLSTQEMNDLRDLTSRFAIQIKSALDHLVQVKWPMLGPLQHGWRADAGLDGGDEVFQFVLHRHFGAIDSFAFCWTSIDDLESAWSLSA